MLHMNICTTVQTHTHTHTHTLAQVISLNSTTPFFPPQALSLEHLEEFAGRQQLRLTTFVPVPSLRSALSGHPRPPQEQGEDECELAGGEEATLVPGQHLGVVFISASAAAEVEVETALATR